MGSVEPLVVNDIDLAGEFGEIPAVAVFKLRSYIGVPIVLQSGRIYGTLCALDRNAQRKSQADIDTMLILARLLASQLDRRELGALEERQRIAREIHDTIAQSLAALTLSLASHARAVSAYDTQLSADAERMGEQTRDALREVRRSIWNLQPGALAGRSLSEAIAAEARSLVRDGIDATLEVSGSPRDLAPPVEAALVRIAQEALTNARKHSGADTIVCSLDFSQASVTLRIDDNGQGFDSTVSRAHSRAGGFGLTSMHERARLTGGELTVERRAGGGTTVVCTVPLGTGDPDTATREHGSSHVSRKSARVTRIGLIDDHAVVREGLRRILGDVRGLSIVGDADDGFAGLALIESERPDVVLLDLQMPRMSGLQVLEGLRDRRLSTRAIVLTTYTQDEMVFQAIRLGARGYLLKDAGADELLRAIDVVAGGGSMLAPLASERLAERVHHPDRLTVREREVLLLLVEGSRNKEIAARLGTSEKTVQFHIANIFGKLDVQSRTEAVRVANERGLLLPASS
jgi:DNA-binding NarL/FixJ family response regulator/signal transduction histidine kinase